MKYWNNILIIAITAAGLTACGDKRYETPLRCDDLPTFFYGSPDAENITDAQREAVDRFVSLQGDWQTTMSCLDQPDVPANVQISEALSSNVELYELNDSSDCELLGKVDFEVTVTGSNDIDLDDQTFTMTADLRVPDPDGGNLLEAISEPQLSQYTGVQSFSLRVIIDEKGEFAAMKETSVTSNESGGMTVTQSTECSITDWVAQ